MIRFWIFLYEYSPSKRIRLHALVRMINYARKHAKLAMYFLGEEGYHESMNHLLLIRSSLEQSLKFHNV